MQLSITLKGTSILLSKVQLFIILQIVVDELCNFFLFF